MDKHIIYLALLFFTKLLVNVYLSDQANEKSLITDDIRNITDDSGRL